jgi:hypothetical protein
MSGTLCRPCQRHSVRSGTPKAGHVLTMGWVAWWLVITVCAGVLGTVLSTVLTRPTQRMRAEAGMPEVSDATTRKRMLIASWVSAPLGALLAVVLIYTTR